MIDGVVHDRPEDLATPEDILLPAIVEPCRNIVQLLHNNNEQRLS